MRHLPFLALLWWATPALTQGAAPKANTLTAKEIADGWLLLFDGATPFGWKIEGSVKTHDGKLALESDGMKEAFGRHFGRFEDFELQFDHVQSGNQPTAFLRLVGNKTLQTAPIPAVNDWTTAKLTVQGGYRFEAGGSPSLQGVTRSSRPQLEWSVGSGSSLSLKNVKLRPGNMKPLFNGKDLAGWKEFPGKKSKFAVTPDGAINIKDGPGDLQTESKYGDFVLQLECISNGKYLNSGVFFRCRPNEYQNGYEAQIRNQFTAEPTQEYVLEEYDPESHKLLAKKKERFTAVDYGTGAIYRRQPARKEVAKDGEWFTLTVVAYKNHFATWVNGIQVTDWTDNRPPSDNARTGCRLEAGHISLQGHDPTTDLSFRNIRIAEIK
jgi:hypothetical protein